MSSPHFTSPIGIVARLFWMLAGPAALLLLAFSLAGKKDGWFSSQSIAFLVVLAAVIATRWLDPQTSDGEPTTGAHLRMFTVMAVGVGLAAWAIANVLGNHWLAL
jgi:hypothetical protein